MASITTTHQQHYVFPTPTSKAVVLKLGSAVLLGPRGECQIKHGGCNFFILHYWIPLCAYYTLFLYFNYVECIRMMIF